MITLKNENCSLEIVFDVQVNDLPSNGDVYVSIKVESNGFSGTNDLWVLAAEFKEFYHDLKLLEEKRKGSATLNSISPNELNMKIFSIDSLGHMAVKGQTGYTIDGFKHSITFGFEFDPHYLTEAIK